ncbi:DUF3500 domain-containing protein [Saccharothrix sp. AJ9571]|nr:DUF3500 domain-containing protein [Saccharothrix sp. AJ9571]
MQPAVYTNTDGEEVQPFAGIYETAFAFYDSLTDEQKAALYQSEDVAAMVCAPGDTCDYPTGTGLSGADLTDEQKQLLLDVIANWAGLADENTTADALAKIETTLDDTYVNWPGATVYDMTPGDGIYFQISGPNAYIEFAGQRGSAGADIDGVLTDATTLYESRHRKVSAPKFVASRSSQPTAGTPPVPMAVAVPSSVSNFFGPILFTPIPFRISRDGRQRGRATCPQFCREATGGVSLKLGMVSDQRIGGSANPRSSSSLGHRPGRRLFREIVRSCLPAWRRRRRGCGCAVGSG